MSTLQIAISIVTFFTLVTICIIVRIKVSDKFKIETTDIVLAIIPIVLWLFLSGKIVNMEYAGLRFESVFKEAKNASVKKEVLPLPIDNISTTLKAGIGQIDYIVSQQKEAVVFFIGYDNYAGEAIVEYLEKLRNTDVKYFVFLNYNDGSFVGLIPFNDFYIQVFQGDKPVATAENVAEWLKNGNIRNLLKIPGMISSDYAVDENDSKEEALKILLDSKSTILPVIDKSKKLKGIVTDGRLSASILHDISEQLNQDQ